MSEIMQTFWSPAVEAEFNAAYETVIQQWPVPYENLFIPTRFGETHIVASGLKQGTPLLLLNPGGGSCAIWIHNIEALSHRYRTYAVDVIGEMNKSLPTRPICNHSDLKDWMTDLLDGLHIQTAHVVGSSNGGFFTLETAFLLPGRVKKVVLISPAATFVQMWAWWWRLLIPAHMIAPLIRSKNMVYRAYEWLWQGFPKDSAFACLRSISVVAGYPRYRTSRNSFVPHVFSEDELRQIRTPVLLLIGDHEVIYNPHKVIQRATSLVADLKAVMVPNANHSAQYTAPEFVNSAILEFLDQKET